MGDPTSFTIHELTGDGRTLDLQGRCLPYKGYQLKGKMRAEFTWYPGNAVASVQMLGAKEEPSTVKGTWKDRFIRSTDDNGFPVTNTGIALLNGQQLADAEAVINAMDSFRLAGQLLEVTWDGTVRRGIMSDFTQNWLRHEVVEWEVTFDWVSRGENEQPITFAKPVDSTSFAGQLKTLVDNLTALAAPAFELADQYSSLINGYIAQITSASDQLTDLATDVSDIAFTAQETARRALAAAQSVQSNANDIRELVESTPAASVIKTDSPTDLTLGDLLSVDVFTRAVKVAARALVALASTEADTLRSSIDQTNLLDSFLARSPTDLRQVSQLYYGTPDEWRTLLQYNQFNSSKLSVGQLVLVPKIEQPDRGV